MGFEFVTLPSTILIGEKVSFELELISTNDGKKVFKSQGALTQLCECGARFRMSSWV